MQLLFADSTSTSVMLAPYFTCVHHCILNLGNIQKKLQEIVHTYNDFQESYKMLTKPQDKPNKDYSTYLFIMRTRAVQKINHFVTVAITGSSTFLQI